MRAWHTAVLAVTLLAGCPQGDDDDSSSIDDDDVSQDDDDATPPDPLADVIGLFNWEENKPAVISYDMGKLGLDPEKQYAAFDFWADTFVAPIRGTLEQTVPGGHCRILAVRPVADHPQLLSTSRHIAQCVVDVLEETWDAKTRTLRGKSRVVAGDRYELRIALPAKGAWKVKTASAGMEKLTPAGITPRGLRLGFTPEASGTVSWRVQF